MKTIRFHTFGCKVNSYETQAIREYALSRGFREVTGLSADWHIINTCTVTAAADAKSIKTVRRVLRENPDACVVALGCLAERDADRLKAAGALHVIPQSRKAEVLRLLDSTSVVRDVWDLSINDFDQHRPFVKVQDGCDNSCSFCKVTLVRGPSRSRPLASVVDECNRLIARGFTEIVLCGTNLARWREGDNGFTRLLERLVGLDGLGRLRLSSIEAEEVSEDLLALMAGEGKICPHLHIPFQSGDDDVLCRMNKRIDRAGYSRIIERIRRHIPDCAISADLMAGFPGEEDVNFRNTLSLIREAELMRVHVFPFSPRPGTVAAKMGPRVVNVAQRVESAYAEARQVSYAWRRRFEGRTAAAVFDEHTPDGRIHGYTEHYIRVSSNKGAPGRSLIPVRIVRVGEGETVVELIA